VVGRALPPESKCCVVCGRTIEWRKKWERNWPEVRYCSDACRRQKLTDLDRLLEAAILDLLAARAGGTTICPSEAAKAVAGADDRSWQPLMQRTRNAARRLVATGDLEVTQRGQVVDPSTAKGPIRLRRR
jgi:hypothetical protein